MEKKWRCWKHRCNVATRHQKAPILSRPYRPIARREAINPRRFWGILNNTLHPSLKRKTQLNLSYCLCISIALKKTDSNMMLRYAVCWSGNSGQQDQANTQIGEMGSERLHQDILCHANWRHQGLIMELGLGLGCAGECLVAGFLPMGPTRSQTEWAM